MTKTDVDIGSWFATPVITVKLPQRDDLHRELTELFRSKEKQGDQHRNPNKIGTQVGDLFESTFDLFSWPDPPVQRLAGECHHVLRDLVGTPNSYTKDQMDDLRFHYHSWFHITRHGGYPSIHYYPNGSWSGIYCVSAGDKVDDRPVAPSSSTIHAPPRLCTSTQAMNGSAPPSEQRRFT